MLKTHLFKKKNQNEIVLKTANIDLVEIEQKCNGFIKKSLQLKKQKKCDSYYHCLQYLHLIFHFEFQFGNLLYFEI